MPRIFGALYKDFDSLKFVGNNLKLKKKKGGKEIKAWKQTRHRPNSSKLKGLQGSKAPDGSARKIEWIYFDWLISIWNLSLVVRT